MFVSPGITSAINAIVLFIAIMLLHVLVSPYNSLYFAINVIMLLWYVMMREYKLLKCCITKYMSRFTGVNKWIVHTEKLIGMILLMIAKRVLAWIATIIVCKSCIIISVVHNYKSLLMVHSYMY